MDSSFKASNSLNYKRPANHRFKTQEGNINNKEVDSPMKISHPEMNLP